MATDTVSRDPALSPTLIQAASELGPDWHRSGALRLAAGELDRMGQCVEVGRVLTEILAADAVNADLDGAETLSTRYRGALIDALAIAFDRIDDIHARFEVPA